MKSQIFKKCQQLFPEWRNLTAEDFYFDDPKGFSTFTMGIRCRKEVNPPAVLYRHLEGKENAILNFESEKEVFLLLGEHEVAAHCHYYDEKCRMETFYQGRTLEANDLLDHNNLKGIADELHRLHQLSPVHLPSQPFFVMLHRQWGELAQHILNDKIKSFPSNEQLMCKELREIYESSTLEKVINCMPEGPITFCHNDTYHGNIMKLESGKIKLLDFEFSCLNYKAYDFSNLWAETFMQHKQSEYPYFKIGEKIFQDQDVAVLINFYLDNINHDSLSQRENHFEKLFKDTMNMMLLSDFKYAMAALPLAVHPIQKIRFIPYAYQRFMRFLEAYEK